MKHHEDIRTILKNRTLKTVERRGLRSHASVVSYYQHFDLEAKFDTNDAKKRQRFNLGKWVFSGALCFGTMVAVANIPGGVLMSDARALQDMQVQLNITPEIAGNNTYVQTAQFSKGDTLSSVLKKMGVEDILAENFIRSNAQARQILLLPLGKKLVATLNEDKQLVQLKTLVKSTKERGLWMIIDRKSDKNFVVRKQFIDHEKETQMRSGAIDNNFFATMAKSAIPSSVANQLIEIFGNTINFQHDIKHNDQFRIVFEKITNNGEFVSYGRILAAEIVNRTGVHQALWYPDKEEYFTFTGDSLKRSLMQNPLSYLKVTSSFGRRVHPIFGYTHGHTGVDFAAPIGTQVFASGEAKVSFVGKQRGYGNLVILDHGKNIKTYYAHLSKFAKNIRVGDSVKQGDVIAFVGKTGSATGAHLHYEVRRNNTPENPMLALGEVIAPLDAQERSQFASYASSTLKQVAVLRQFNLQYAAES